MATAYLTYDGGTLSAKIQQGPIKEVGLNGCQVDDVIKWTRNLIAALDKNQPCRENALALTKLDEAIMWLNMRRLDREARGVEGFEKP